MGKELTLSRFDEVKQTRIFSNALFEVKMDTLYGIIDSKAKILIPCEFTNIETNYFERFTYQYGIKIIPVRKDNKSGLYFIKDKQWKELEFDEVRSIDSQWIIIRKSNKFYLLSNPELNYRFPQGYDNLSYLDYGEKYNKAIFKYEENKLLGIIEMDGNILSLPKYTSFKRTFKNKAEIENLQLSNEITPVAIGVLEDGSLEVITLKGESIQIGNN